MPTATHRGVELVKVGTWAASTGVTTVTRDDLEAMVAAASDPEVDAVPLKVGHVDPRFDGEPALGWVENLRVEGDTLLGDVVGIPSKLSETMPTAFRRRSVEIAWGVRTPSGKRYAAALTGLALLGVTPPAVRGLSDVLALYSSGGLDDDERTTLELGRGHQLVAPEHRLDAGVALPDGTLAATRRSRLSVADDLDGDPEVLGATLTALHAIARLARAEDAPASTVDALRSAVDGLTAAAPPPDEPPHPTTQEAPTMPVDEARIRELLELEADADVEAAIVELRDRPAADPATTTDPAPAPNAQDPATPDPASTREPELATLSAAAVEQLVADAAAGRQASEQLLEQERTRVLGSALSSGRITPAERQTWEAALQRDHEGTVTLLSSLTPTVPVAEVGSDATGSELSAGADDAAWAAFERDVFGIEPTTTEGS